MYDHITTSILDKHFLTSNLNIFNKLKLFFAFMFPEQETEAYDEYNEDEDEHAYFMGAKFDVYNNDFAAIEASTHLGSVQIDKQRIGSFIQADSFNIEGVNADAEQFIRSEFSRGIWLKVL
jgi:hypothetical protein